MRSPAFSQWAIILPWRSRIWTSSPSSAASVMMSGITTIVISSTAARPPMPLRRATSPSKCVGLTSVGSIDGAESLNVPVAGARCASGSDAPVSSILISFDWALTFVARLLRPFLVDRPVNSSLSAPEFTRTV